MSPSGEAPAGTDEAAAAAGGTGEPAAGGDWHWRRTVRANPTSRRIYRAVVAVVGMVVVVVGILLVPLPGPGWLIVFLGLGIWASEFSWAQRLLRFAKDSVRQWTRWAARQSIWVSLALAVVTAAVLLALVYGYLKWQGAPGVLPDDAEAWLTRTMGLPD